MAKDYTEPIETADGINHGLARTEYCLEAVIERFQDWFVLCPVLWSGGSCEDCMSVFNERLERYSDD